MEKALVNPNGSIPSGYGGVVASFGKLGSPGCESLSGEAGRRVRVFYAIKFKISGQIILTILGFWEMRRGFSF